MENTEPTAGNLDILYQDDFLVVVNKPAGMLVHQGRDSEPRVNLMFMPLLPHLSEVHTCAS